MGLSSGKRGLWWAGRQPCLDLLTAAGPRDGPGPRTCQACLRLCAHRGTVHAPLGPSLKTVLSGLFAPRPISGKAGHRLKWEVLLRSGRPARPRATIRARGAPSTGAGGQSPCASSVRGISSGPPGALSRGCQLARQAQAHGIITTRARRLLIKILYFRRPLKKRPSTLDRRPTTPSAFFFGLFCIFFLFKSTKTI